MQVVFVGNGTMTIDYHELVDNADLVIRSQKCENYRGFAGTKTDILCVRPCDVPFGRMLAAHRMIPVQPARDCKCIITIQHRKHIRPDMQLLFTNYPCLRNKTMITLLEVPTIRLLSRRGGMPLDETYASMGMCVLHRFIQLQLYKFMQLLCVGFAWGYKDSYHKPQLECDIQREWEAAGYLRFL